MLTVTVGIQKGGVGKTTTAVNLAHRLALDGINTLLVDLDSQGQAGTFLGLSDEPEERRVVDLIRHHSKQHPFRPFVPARDTVHRGLRARLDVIGSDPRLAPTEVEVRQDPNAGRILERRLAELDSDYVVCIVDVGPGVTFASELAYVAADLILTPVTPGQAPTQGLQELERRLAHLNEGYGLAARPHLVFANVLDTRERLSRALDEHLATLGDRRGPDVRKNVKIAEAVAAGQSIFEYAPRSPGADDYRALTQWLRDHLRSLL